MDEHNQILSYEHDGLLISFNPRHIIVDNDRIDIRRYSNRERREWNYISEHQLLFRFNRNYVNQTIILRAPFRLGIKVVDYTKYGIPDTELKGSFSPNYSSIQKGIEEFFEKLAGNVSDIVDHASFMRSDVCFMLGPVLFDKDSYSSHGKLLGMSDKIADMLRMTVFQDRLEKVSLGILYAHALKSEVVFDPNAKFGEILDGKLIVAPAPDKGEIATEIASIWGIPIRGGN